MYQKIKELVFVVFLIKLCACTTPIVPVPVVVEENPLKGLKKGLWIPIDTLTIDDNIPYLIVGNDTNYLTCLSSSSLYTISRSSFFDYELNQIESRGWGLHSSIREKVYSDSLFKLDKYYYLDFIKTNKEKNQLIYIHGEDTIKYRYFFEKSPLSLDEFWALDSVLNSTVWDEKIKGIKESTIIYESFSGHSFLDEKLKSMIKSFIQLKNEKGITNKMIRTNHITLYYQKNILFLFIEYGLERRIKRYVVENIDSTQWDLINIEERDEKLTLKRNTNPSSYIKSILKDKQKRVKKLIKMQESNKRYEATKKSLDSLFAKIEEEKVIREDSLKAAERDSL